MMRFNTPDDMYLSGMPGGQCIERRGTGNASHQLLLVCILWLTFRIKGLVYKKIDCVKKREKWEHIC